LNEKHCAGNEFYRTVNAVKVCASGHGRFPCLMLHVDRGIAHVKIQENNAYYFNYHWSLL
jgi:hypothetical protein